MLSNIQQQQKRPIEIDRNARQSRFLRLGNAN